MDKKAIAERILKQGGTLSVHFNPQLGANVPPQFRNERHVRFDYGYNMPHPIPDLELTKDGISATLLFAGRERETFVSWKSVLAMSNDTVTDGGVWGQPSEIPTRPKLQLIQGGRK